MPRLEKKRKAYCEKQRNTIQTNPQTNSHSQTSAR